MKRMLALLVIALSFSASPPALTAPATSVHSTSTIVADGIATGTVRLSTVAVSGLPSFATRVWVKTVGDWFVIAPAVASTKANVIVAALDGRQFVRQGVANPVFLAAKFWAIDETNGNDENLGYGSTLGAADAVPLKTMAELNRRLVGSDYDGVTFHQLSSLTTGEVLANLSTKNGFVGRPTWKGSRVSTDFSGVLTTYTAAVPSADTGVTITISSLPTSFTASGLVGKMIESADKSRYAWILKDLGSKTARITTPTNADGSTFSPGTAATFTGGETLNVVSLTDIPVWPFPSAGIQYAGVDCVNFIDSPAFDVFDTGSTSSLVTRTKFASEGILTSKSSNGTAIEGCLVSASFFGFYVGTANISFTGFLGSSVFVQGGSLNVSHGPVDLQASKIQVTGLGANINTFGSGAVLSAFDVTTGTAVISVNDYATFGRVIRMNSTQPVYGSGNTVPIMSLTKGCSYTLLPPALWYVTTGAANPLVVDGAGHPFSDIPFRDTNTGTFVNLAP